MKQLAQPEIDARLKQARDLVHVDYAKSLALSRAILEDSIAADYTYGQGIALQLIGLNESQSSTSLPETPFRESIRLLERVESWSELCRSICYLAYSVGRKGRTSECEELLARAMELARQHGDPSGEALAYTHLGNLLARRKQVAKAQHAFHRALELWETAGENGRLALNGLALVYRETKQFDEAIKYLDRLITVSENVDRSALVLAHANRGLVLEEAGKPEAALSDLLQALTIAEDLKNSRNSFQIRTAIPRVHLTLDQPDLALGAVEELFAMVDESTEDIFRAAAYHSRADYLRYMRQWELAIKDLKFALELAERAGNIDQVKHIHRELTECYRGLTDFEKALEHQELYAKIVTDYASQQLDARVSLMETEYRQQQIAHQNEIFRLRNLDLTEANLALSDANRQKDRFLSILQHDVRHPISSIIGYANLMASGEGGMDVTEVASIVEESARRLLKVMDDLIKSARAGSLTVERKPVNISALLSDVERIVRPLAESKELIFTVSDTTQEKTFPLDLNKFYQALTNLTFNAIKFTPSGKAIKVSAGFEQEGSLRFAVQDEGIGIPQAFLPRIFDGGKDLQRKGTLGEASSGLGLSITKKVVDLHHGRIMITSEENRGTEIVIVVPA